LLGFFIYLLIIEGQVPTSYHLADLQTTALCDQYVKAHTNATALYHLTDTKQGPTFQLASTKSLFVLPGICNWFGKVVGLNARLAMPFVQSESLVGIPKFKKNQHSK